MARRRRRSRFVPRAKYTPQRKPIKIRDILDRTILLPMNATLAFAQRALRPDRIETPIEAAWDVITGKAKPPTGRQIAEEQGLKGIKASMAGFGIEMVGDPLVLLPMNKIMKGVVKGTSKGTKILAKAMAKSPRGRDMLSTFKGLRRGFDNIFKYHGYIADADEIAMMTRGQPVELKALIEGSDFITKRLESKTTDAVVKLASKAKNFSEPDLAMIGTLIEKSHLPHNHRLSEVMRIHNAAPDKNVIKMSADIMKMFKLGRRAEKKSAAAIGRELKDMRATGYMPHYFTDEAIKVLEEIHPMFRKKGGVRNIANPASTNMMHRLVGGSLRIPNEFVERFAPRTKSLAKYYDATTNTYKIPLADKMFRIMQKRKRNVKRALKIPKNQQLPESIRPTFEYLTGAEINQLGRAGKLPIFRGKKVDKVIVDNPFIAATLRLHNTARSVPRFDFLRAVTKSDDAGGFARIIKEGDEIPIGWDRSQMVTKWVRGGHKMVFPNEVVKAVDKAERLFTQPEEARRLLGLFDSVQSMWKQITLLPMPGYHIRNLFGNLYNNWLGGLDNPYRYFEALSIMDGKKGKIGKYSYDRVRQMIVNHSIRGRGFFAKEASQAKLLARIQERVAPTTAQRINPLYFGRLVGEKIEDTARVAMFIDRLKKGDSAADAAKAVKKFLFNYDELSVTERQVFRRVLPFYTWSRFNIPLQIEQAIMNPGRWTAWAKGARAIEPVTKPDERYMPDWMKESVPVLAKRDSVSGQYQYLLFKNWIPAADLQDLLKGDTFIEMLSPLIKAPIEWFTNYSSFAERSIERYPSEVQNYLGVEMPRKVANLVRNVRLLNELDRMNPGYIFGTKTRRGIFGFKRPQEMGLPMKVRLLNLLAGVKLQPYHFEMARRHKRRVQAENIQALRSFRRYAGRRGVSRGEQRRIGELIEDTLSE